MKPIEHFKELTKIPHGSGNTKAISDYCVAYARARGFETLQDALNNVLIRVPATEGYEDHPTVVLQGHLDMVCEKEPGSTHDFLTDPLELREKDGWLFANGTTLGGDDGIAVAYGLALLDEETPHPPLELFFTVDEETGMFGALGFDPAWITGRRMLNLDSEEEGEFIISSAGGKTLTARLPLAWEPSAGRVWNVTVDGLRGGHSGAEIHRGLANANSLLSRILAGTDCRLISFAGGAKNNVITGAAAACIAAETPPDAAAWTAAFRKEFEKTDPDLRVTVAAGSAPEMLTEPVSRRAIGLLSSLPHGVREWSGEIPGLVETSDNFAVVKTERGALTVTVSVRSMKNEKRDRFCAELAALAEKHGAEATLAEGYPAWEYRADSPIREKVCEAYRARTGKEPKLVALHAGLECGLFAERLPGLDAVSFGPDMKDIHSPRERLDLASAERCWELIKETLKNL